MCLPMGLMFVEDINKVTLEVTTEELTKTGVFSLGSVVQVVEITVNKKNRILQSDNLYEQKS